MEPQPLADKIRKHFLSTNYSYRTPATAVDLDSSSDSSFDLSASFEREIRSRKLDKAKLNMSSNDKSSLRVDTERSGAAAEDADSTMNRMFTGLELCTGNKTVEENLLDVQEPSMFERLSPCKRVGLTRPSTVAEESLLSNSRSICTTFASEKQVNRNFTPSLDDSDGSINYTRDSLHGQHLTAGSSKYEQDSLEATTSEASGTTSQYYTDLGRPESDQSVLKSPEFVPDDTLEDVEYDRNDSRYVLRPIQKPDRLPSVVSVDSSPLSSGADEVIELDDSGSDHDTSFKTARSHARTETEKSFTKDKRDVTEGLFPNHSRSFLEDDEHLSVSMRNRTEANKSRATDINELNVISLIDSDSDEENDQENVEANVADISEPVATQVPNMSHDSGRSSHDLSDGEVFDPSMLHPDQFNDTIERMDFMIEQGRRIVEAQRSAKKIPGPSPVVQKPSPFITPARVTNSPAKPKLFGTPMGHDSPILKAKSTNSPLTITNSGFKKPMPIKTMTPSTSSLKKATPSSGSRIPKPLSASKMSAFDYVKSPIGAYISQRAPNPLRQNLNPTRDFLDSTYCTGAAKGLDFTLPGAQQTEQMQRYPKKIYIEAINDKIIDRRTFILPGDQNVMKLLGTRPALIRTRGMAMQHPPPMASALSGLFAEYSADFLAQFKITSGDINVLDVFDV